MSVMMRTVVEGYDMSPLPSSSAESFSHVIANSAFQFQDVEVGIM